MWRDGQALEKVPITWDVLKTAFLESFFPIEQREAKVEEFINLKQGSISVKEYSMRFVRLLSPREATLAKVWHTAWGRMFDGL
ncbi:hypothetical protein, partial [Acinetobacter baumannii]|uniref:hypothetical protein n=1 Tax=Acinetobacter baumannii TaxID=470 RepID=UPI003395F490